MPANLENSAVATGLEKVSFHSNPKERQKGVLVPLIINSLSNDFYMDLVNCSSLSPVLLTFQGKQLLFFLWVWTFLSQITICYGLNVSQMMVSRGVALGRAFMNGIAAAAAAKSLHSCLTLCDPKDGSPLGSSIPGILQARILEWVATSFSNSALKKVAQESSLALSHLVKKQIFTSYQICQYLDLVLPSLQTCERYTWNISRFHC